MFQIDNSTAATTAPTTPAVGPNPGGHFTSGVPGSTPAVPATIVDAYWLETVQAELCNAITSDGTALNKSNQSQLAAKLVGRLLNVQRFTASGTYTPTAGTTSVIAEVQGGGGASAGSPATGAGQASLGAPGSGGAYAKGQLTSGFSGGTVTVGAGGTVGGAGAAGGNGGTSGFSPTSGTPVVASGGAGGNVAAAQAPPLFAGAGATAAATGGSIINMGGQSGGMSLGLNATENGATGGVGGNSRFGVGGAATLAPGVGQASGYGSGAGGTANIQSSSAIVGGNGRPGIVIVWEYS